MVTVQPTLLVHFQQDLKIEFEQVNNFLRICSMNTVLSEKQQNQLSQSTAR